MRSPRKFLAGLPPKHFPIFRSSGQGESHFKARMSQMSNDDLTTPLGIPGRRAPEATPRKASVPAIAATLACTLGAGAAALIWINDDGLGGRPMVVAKVEQLEQVVQAKAIQSVDANPTGSIGQTAAGNPRASAADVESSSGVRVTRQGGGDIPGALIITVPAAPGISLTPAPDRQLVEKGPHGSLPRIGPGGRKAMDVYSRPVSTSAKLPANAPRIALMISGMGLSQKATAHAMDKLPREVTLAFAPYGSGLTTQVESARDKGYEVILQMPMEPYDLASDGDVPHMLRTNQERAVAKDNLHWFLSRFPGYVGVSTFLGAKFLADANALTPVIEEIGARGLFILDDSSAAQSQATKIATASATPYILADVILDSDRSGQAIEKALLQLETVAREKGSALGVATGLPEVVDRIGGFAARLERRGIALVPVSALAVRNTRPIAARIKVSPGQ